MHRNIVGFTRCTCLCQCTNSPLVLTMLNSFSAGMALTLTGEGGRGGEREVEGEIRGKVDDIDCSSIYVLLCPANGKLSVCAAVLFLLRSSNVLPIGSANPQICFLSF